VSELSELQNLFRGYKRCHQCMMFHVFAEELKRIGDLPKDHAWYIEPHLTKEQKEDAMYFNHYTVGSFHYFADEKTMFEWAKYNKLIKPAPGVKETGE
jgi:hypothetical protein